MTTSLLHIPDLPMEMILTNLDFPTILVLRKTCWRLRNFIDDKKPAPPVNRLEICQSKDKINMNLRSDINWKLYPDGPAIFLKFEKCDVGCRIEWERSDERKVKVLENVDYLNIVLREFEIVLSNQKSIFETVMILKDESNFLDEFEKMMKSRKLLPVEYLEINADCQTRVNRILKHADPKYLKSIDITLHEFSDEAMKIRENLKMENWKPAQNKQDSSNDSEDKIEELSHFSVVSVPLENPDVATLRALKETFLQYHECKKYFSMHSGFLQAKNFIDAFGTSSEYNTWFFRNPNDTEKVLEIYFGNHFFDVKFIEKSELSENSVIVD